MGADEQTSGLLRMIGGARYGIGMQIPTFAGNDGGVSDSVAGLLQSGRFGEVWPHAVMSPRSEEGTFGSSLDSLELIPSSAIAADGTLAAFALGLRRSVEKSPSVGLISSALVAVDELRRRSTSDDPDEMFFRSFAEMSLLRSAGYLENAASAAVAVLGRIAAMDPQLQVQLAPAIERALLQAASVQVASANLIQAEHTLTLLGWQRDPMRRQRSIELGAFIRAMRGEIDTATQLIAPLERDWRGEKSPSTLGRVARVAIHLEHGDVRSARAEMRAFEVDLPAADEWPWALTVAARVHIATDAATGVEELNRLLGAFGGQPSTKRLRRVMLSAVADLSLAAGDVQRATQLTVERDPGDHALRLTAARIGLITNSRDAIPDLRDLVATDDLWPRLRAQGFLLLAVHLHRSNQLESAQGALRRAVAITQGLGIRLIHALVPRSELEAIVQGTDIRLPTNVNRANPLEDTLVAVSLTPRERTLLGRLAGGDSLREIADAEFVVLATVKSQVRSMYRKIGAKSRHDAVEIAYRRGILP
ncbi:MAG: hypothetical protein DI566_13060 [Microbacterium sp.]|nr:MAG: hypothetical protein DI566_13060 [Microbacterium sp.]